MLVIENAYGGSLAAGVAVVMVTDSGSLVIDLLLAEGLQGERTRR